MSQPASLVLNKDDVDILNVDVQNLYLEYIVLRKESKKGKHSNEKDLLVDELLFKDEALDGMIWK